MEDELDTGGGAEPGGRRRRDCSDPVSGCSDIPDCGDLSDCADIGDCGCSWLTLTGPALLTVLARAARARAVDPHTVRPRSPAARLASRVVRSYQLNVSAHRAPVCNLSPSCSRYGLQVLAEHGLLRGLRLIRARLAACRAAGLRGFGSGSVPGDVGSSSGSGD